MTLLSVTLKSSLLAWAHTSTLHFFALFFVSCTSCTIFIINNKRCTEKRCNLSWNTKHQINQLTNCHSTQASDRRPPWLPHRRDEDHKAAIGRTCNQSPLWTDEAASNRAIHSFKWVPSARAPKLLPPSEYKLYIHGKNKNKRQASYDADKMTAVLTHRICEWRFIALWQ